MSIDTNLKGGWVECMLKNCKLMFFKYEKDSKYHSLSDEIGTCPLCTHKKQIENKVGKYD